MVSVKPAVKKTTVSTRTPGAAASLPKKTTTTTTTTKQTVPKTNGAAAASKTSGSKILGKVDDYECPVCLELCAQPVITPCKHYMCYACSKRVVQQGMTCPMCRAHFDRNFVPMIDKEF